MKNVKDLRHIELLNDVAYALRDTLHKHNAKHTTSIFPEISFSVKIEGIEYQFKFLNK